MLWLLIFILGGAASGQQRIGGGQPLGVARGSYPTFFDGSSACGSGIGAASYILATFNGTSDLLEIGFSPDAKNFCYDLSQTTFSLRDPSFIKLSSTYYIAHTQTTGTLTAWYFTSSSDGKNWAADTSVSITGGGLTGVTATWAPRWFVDTDGSLHMLVAISTSGTSANPTNFKTYEMHCSSATTPTGACWSNPAALTVTGESSVLDPMVVCLATGSGDIPCTGSTSGNTYYLFYTTGPFPGNEYGQYASASSLTGTYTDVKTGDWNSDGCGSANGCEGQYVAYIGTTWYRYFDFNTSGSLPLSAGQIQYSTSTNWTGSTGTWTAKLPIATAPYQAKHGTIYSYP